MTARNTKYALKIQVTTAAGMRTSHKYITGLIVALSLLGSVTPASAQLTPMPQPLIQWFTNNGEVANAYGLCVFRAGTSTLASTYTTAAGSVANSNPIVMNSAGRPTSGGVFLTPGESYKFVYKDSTVTTCVPDTGVTIFTVDNVQAVPGSASAVDVANATAGESIAAGDAVFMSNGSNSLNAGQWYRTDSDLTYKSTSAVMVGIAPSAIAAAASGSIRISGTVTVSGPLNTGSAYYAGATPGAIVSTPPTNAIRIGQAQSATVLVLGFTDAPVSPRGPPCGRLTLTSGVPVTRADVTAATTLYYTPAGSCNSISLYDGTAWTEYAFAELSIAVPATTNTAYDVFAYDNAGVVALELTAWTSLTTRATAYALQNGVYVKSGTPTRRLLGSFRTTGVSGQTEDSVTKRYVSNVYNRARRELLRLETTPNWAYTTATVRQANGAAANQVEIFVSVDEVVLDLSLTVHAVNSTSNQISFGIGEGSTTTYASGAWILGTAATFGPTIHLRKAPVVGYQFYSWNEFSTAAGTTTWYGTNTIGSTVASGLRGWIEG